ncbi:ankyrin repeat domain-containing protein [Acidovorax sp. CCYZU-2555]|uniref:ankyrin repeat domain-containing protein n=1 Tax=Acidovorax sp. CCYZU-2555 TaxID=2835042 RepID=UPI001BCF7BDF|nr:ankyrin repeat domain-containing protein [Acidovorax sp. CCYZU-2555]MBS7779902.1 ankyrin repeat domain-containing protein [Acidovorax sp. CCYZU-2555]
MNFGNSAEETALPRIHTAPPAPDTILAAVQGLIFSIRIGDLSWFKKIMNDNDRIFSSDILNKHEILHQAVFELQPEMVKTLLDRECKPDIDGLHSTGHTPLSLAFEKLEPDSSSDHYQIIDLLMENGANTKVFFPNGLTPWSTAVSTNDLALAELLLKHCADPNETNIYGTTPIGHAADKRNSEMVDLLIRAKAEVNSPLNASLFNDPLRTILGVGCGKDNTPEKIKIVQSIVAAGSKIKIDHIDWCFGDNDLLNILAGGNIDTEDSSGITAREVILDNMKIQISDPTYEQNLPLETANIEFDAWQLNYKQNLVLDIANREFDAGHLNLVKVLLDSIEDSEEKKAFISHRLKTAEENGIYLKLNAPQKLGVLFGAELHAETGTTAVEIVNDAQTETSKTPSKEESHEPDATDENLDAVLIGTAEY